MTRLHLAALLAALLAGPARQDAARPDAARPAPRTLAELQARIREVLARTHTPGIALALVTRDSVLWAGGLGKADVASGRDATGATLFRIGSTSKAFTALAALMLQEEGKLRLDDPLRKHIPAIRFENRWEATDPVRIVNALEHTSGFDDWAFREYSSNDPTPLTLRQGLDFNAPGSRVSRWRPGTRVSYCNSGPPLVAYVVETVEGKPFEQVVQERLFGPIGMRTATYLFPDTTTAPLAALYQSDGRRTMPYWHILERPAGSINASAEDMAQYVRFLLNRGAVNGRQLVPAAAIERLERSESSLGARAGLPVGYGLHMYRYVDSGYVWTGHDGGVDGGLTNMAYIPERGVGFAFMINTGSGEAYEQISRLVRDFVTADIPRPTPPPPAPLPAGVRERYAGWYRPDNPRTQHLYFAERLLGLARVAVDDSALVLKPLLGASARFLPVRDMTFRGEREPVPTLALVDDSVNDRPVAIEQASAGLPTSLVRVATPVALLEIALTALWAAAVVVTLAALVVGLVRRLRRRPASPARALWWVALGATLSLALAMALMVFTFLEGVRDLGGRGPAMVGAYVLLWLFLAFAVAGVALAVWRPRAAVRGRLPAASLWTARAVAVLNLIAAAYLLYWGFIGWRTWA